MQCAYICKDWEKHTRACKERGKKEQIDRGTEKTDQSTRAGSENLMKFVFNNWLLEPMWLLLLIFTHGKYATEMEHEAHAELQSFCSWFTSKKLFRLMWNNQNINNINKEWILDNIPWAFLESAFVFIIVSGLFFFTLPLETGSHHGKKCVKRNQYTLYKQSDADRQR